MQNDIFNAIRNYILKNVPSIFFITTLIYDIYSTSELNDTITYRVNIPKKNIQHLKHCILTIKTLLKDIEIYLRPDEKYNNKSIDNTCTFYLKIDLKKANLLNIMTILKLYGFDK